MSDANELAEPSATPPTTTTPAVDASGQGTTPEKPDLGQLAAEQSKRTTADFFDKPPGYKGTGRPAGSRDTKKRKSKLPVAFVDDGSNSASGPTPTGAASENFPGEVAGQSFDEETAEAMVDMAVEVFADLRAEFNRFRVFRLTGDGELAKQFAAPMPEKLEQAIRRGGFLCAKKYAVSLEYAPETMLLGGLALVLGSDHLKFKRLKADFQKLREEKLNPPAP